MPGLLQTDEYEVWSKRYIAACLAEFGGVLLFSLYGQSAPTRWAPWSNGLVLAVLVFITANCSGGHLNPAVTTATIVSGHISIYKALSYYLMQISGAVCGSLLQAGLYPGVHPGSGVGCFTPNGISAAQLFGWEAVGTFLLVSTVFAVAVSEPHFGNIAPLAVGLALFSIATVTGEFTGASVNPARTLGPAIVFQCGRSSWRHTGIYIAGELLGGLAAGACGVILYGKGPDYGRLMCHSRNLVNRVAGRPLEACSAAACTRNHSGLGKGSDPDAASLFARDRERVAPVDFGSEASPVKGPHDV